MSPLLRLMLNARTCWSPSVAIQMKPVPVAPPLPDETQLNMAAIKIAATSKPKADFMRIRTPLEKVSMFQDFTASAYMQHWSRAHLLPLQKPETLRP